MGELKKKHHEEMDLIKQNQDKLLSELLLIRKNVYKQLPANLVKVRLQMQTLFKLWP